MRTFQRTFTYLVLLFLYIPMVVLAVASFNAGTDPAVWKGFTLHNYSELFADGVLLPMLLNSVIIAVLSSLIATVLGTAASIGMHDMKPRLRSMYMTVTNIPMTNPDIVTGVSLALLFAFAGTLLKMKSVLGFVTLLIAHITFSLPYIIMSVLPKLSQMDPDLQEAAMDLGCTPRQAFFKVVLHEIMPGVISGALMAFTMSLDDFVISYFTMGEDFQTLPIFIFNMTKRDVKPTVYALATVIFFVILALLMLSNLFDSETSKSMKEARKKKKAKKQAI